MKDGVWCRNLPRVSWSKAVALALLLAACGGESGAGDAGASGGSPAGGRAGTSGGAGASGTAGATGSGGSSSAGAGNGGTGATIDCEGDFGNPRPILTAPEDEVGSLSISADELELVYALGPGPENQGARSFFHSVRPNKQAMFPAGDALPSLNVACGDDALYRSGDLSADGLSYYFVCYASGDAAPTDLHVARRASRADPFAVDATTYGQVSSGPTVDSTELLLITSPTNAQTGAPLAFTRADTSSPFSNGTALTGLESLVTPDLSSDDRSLFGSSRTASTLSSIQVATRSAPGGAFGAPVALLTDTTGVLNYGSPAISADCRSLYFVSLSGPPYVYTAMVMQR